MSIFVINIWNGVRCCGQWQRGFAVVAACSFATETGAGDTALLTLNAKRHPEQRSVEFTPQPAMWGRDGSRCL